MRLAAKGRRKPPDVSQHLAGSLPELLWLYPDRRFAETEVPPGPAVCPRCHASLVTDHWQYDEQKYHRLRALPDTRTLLCPGCTRVERRLYEGEVRIRHRWDIFEKETILNLIHNEEARARVANPAARIALIEDHGDELYVLTTTRFLAERIGKALYKACHGTLRRSPLPRERFTRVWWER